MTFGHLGALGVGFSKQGAASGAGTPPTPPVLVTPMMRFNVAANSQLLAVLDDF